MACAVDYWYLIIIAFFSWQGEIYFTGILRNEEMLGLDFFLFSKKPCSPGQTPYWTEPMLSLGHCHFESNSNLKRGQSSHILNLHLYAVFSADFAVKYS